MKRILILGSAGLVVVLLLIMVGACALDETAERSASLSAADATSVRIYAQAGSLQVTGRSGITEVSIAGTAYARSTRDLEDVQIVTKTDGSEIVIELETPPHTKFDVAVEIPDSLQVEIVDGSGSIEVSNVAGVRLTDGSGDIDVSGVTGDIVVVGDGSGDITIKNVGQDVDIVDDGSGSITAADITGSVRVGKDGSGDITIENVGQDVDIGDDGSGSIDARDIDGDFTVENDGSGSITHSNVQGTVDIPGD